MAARHAWVHSVLWANTTQHFLRNRPAAPAGNGRRKIDVAPFWMARGLKKLVPFAEKAVDEPFNAPVAIVSLRPIENREHRGGRDRIDGLTCRNQRRIFFARQLTDRIVIGKGLQKWNRRKVKSRRGSLRKSRSVFRSHGQVRRVHRS